MKPKTYTVKQAAELAGVPHATFCQRLWRDAKRPVEQRKYPTAHKIGRDWFLSKEDVHK